MNTTAQHVRQVRRNARQRRKQLTPQQQKIAARSLLRRLRRHPWYRFNRRIAFYLAGDGEISLAPLLDLAHRQGKQCFLPVMRREGPERLFFVRYRPGEKLYRKWKYVQEPRTAVRLPAWGLGLVLVPLVAFDANCQRIGMGKGYYDRTFSFKPLRRRHSPRLLGVAHECQRVENLQPAPWDVQLDGVATPDRIYLAP